MRTLQSQIKINIPLKLKEYIESKARRYGLPLAGYIRHLILKDIEDMEYPIFTASEKTERAYSKALEQSKKGKPIKVENLDKYLSEL